MSQLTELLSNNQNKNVEELKELLRIPSISSLSEHKEDIQKAASWISNKLKNIGMEHVEIIQTKGHPIIYADWIHQDHAPTVLVYGHYDVQPVDPVDLWETPPFEPTIRDEKIFARGATDDKGQLFLHIKAVETLLELGEKLPVNIKFCIEGEEEIGSPNLPYFLSENKEKLSCDVVLISDTDMWDKGVPAITCSLRGLCALEVTLKTANSDLHSGMFGGGVQNANHLLVQLLSTLSRAASVRHGRTARRHRYHGRDHRYHLAQALPRRFGPRPRGGEPRCDPRAVQERNAGEQPQRCCTDVLAKEPRGVEGHGHRHDTGRQRRSIDDRIR